MIGLFATGGGDLCFRISRRITACTFAFLHTLHVRSPMQVGSLSPNESMFGAGQRTTFNSPTSQVGHEQRTLNSMDPQLPRVGPLLLLSIVLMFFCFSSHTLRSVLRRSETSNYLHAVPHVLSLRVHICTPVRGAGWFPTLLYKVMFHHSCATAN